MKRLVLVGIGGYGNIYLEEVQRAVSEGRLSLAAVVDPRPEHCKQLGWLERQKVPIFSTLAECLGRSPAAELAIVSTPSSTHEVLGTALLEAGIPLLCEKPITSDIEGAERLVQVQLETGTTAAVGFQLSFSPAMRMAKEMARSGCFGRPLRLRSLCCWPRSLAYYTRNKYAGRIKDEHGVPVLDSPAGNAMAHFIHNMFFVLGATAGSCAWPVSLTAEAFRAYDIENYDTVAVRGLLECGAEFLFLGSHACDVSHEPLFEYEFEEGSLLYNAQQSDKLSFRSRDGSVRDFGVIPQYPAPDYFRKMYEFLDRDADWVNPAPLESALPHVYTVEGIQQSLSDIPFFPKIQRRLHDDQVWRLVDGLGRDLMHCYESWSLPSESGKFPYASPGTAIEVRAAARAAAGGSKGRSSLLGP